MGKQPGQKSDASPRSALKRWLPLIVLVLATIAVFAAGWHRQLSLGNIADHRAELRSFLADHAALAPLAYVVIYTVAVALSVPGGLVLTLTGGFLFGCVVGGLLTVIAATIGATVVFLVARMSCTGSFVEQAGPWLVKLREGFKSNALSYLLFLRLVPAFPFWLVNLAAAVLDVPLTTFVFGTLIGIIPGSFAFASLGAGLDSVIAAAEAEHAACVAAKGPDQCHVSLHAGSLVTKELILAFCLLGLVALIPIVLKKWRARNAAT
jgi:uncharacterized membrane protein YdjX (TVP38/TMEM64 family)